MSSIFTFKKVVYIREDELDSEFSKLVVTERQGVNEESTVDEQSSVKMVPPASTKTREMQQKYQSSGTTLVNSVGDLEEFEVVAFGKYSLAIDAEGVNLSRLGKLTVFSVGVEVDHGVHVFLFDMIHGNLELKEAQVVVLKRLLEDRSIEKIIHDCRQDSDALKTQFQIVLRNVFDTSVYCLKVERTSKRENLNKALRVYGCPLNHNRDTISDLYKTNPTFWQTRPLTPFMMEYASKDVASLFDLRAKLLERVTANMPAQSAAIRQDSEHAADEFRGKLYHEIVPVPANKRGCVIGRQGSGVASIERRTGAVVSCHGAGFLVIASSPAVLARAKAAINESYY